MDLIRLGKFIPMLQSRGLLGRGGSRSGFRPEGARRQGARGFKARVGCVSAAAVFLGIAVFFQGDCAAIEWKELKGEHFIIYYTADENFAKEVASNAEDYYRDIALDLGYPRYKEFWIWDKRVKIYIYPDQPSFLEASGQPDWAHGMADYKNKEILSYLWSKGFIDSLLPHEIAHLVFRDFIGFQGEVPLWVDEGVAQWAEKPRRAELEEKVHTYLNQDGLLSLDDMMKIDIHMINDPNKLYIRISTTRTGEKGILFLSANHLINTYYLQAFSLVGFLIEKYGSTAFSQFCRELRDGKNVEGALRSAYPESMRTLDDFETQWRKYLQEEK
jgi:hypothetical protein